jgi:spore maturation protein CgeB
MENIAVKNGESCIEYSDAKEVVDLLRDIPINLERYEEIAENGCRCVLGYHNREKIARELFGEKTKVFNENGNFNHNNEKYK